MKTLHDVKELYKGTLEQYLDWNDDDSKKRLENTRDILSFIYGKDFDTVVNLWAQEELNEFFSALYKGKEV